MGSLFKAMLITSKKQNNQQDLIMSNKVMPILNKNLNSKTITHGFFTREGGFSNDKNFSLNCSFNASDTTLNVKK